MLKKQNTLYFTHQIYYNHELSNVFENVKVYAGRIKSIGPPAWGCSYLIYRLWSDIVTPLPCSFQLYSTVLEVSNMVTLKKITWNKIITKINIPSIHICTVSNQSFVLVWNKVDSLTEEHK